MRRARGQVRERGDALPEHIQYRDTGCDLSPSCLNCTLPLCRYDQPPEPPGTAYRAARRLCMIGRDEEIARVWRREHLSIKALAQRFGVSRNTILRALKPARRRPGCNSRPPADTGRSAGQGAHAA